ncbi:hypothetical protein DFH09DRAFT_1077460 [Mycena vulgaris]|nr:hypothetical protein DFH09DRAFT_1077460 [Mycena vulgaris]
MWKIEDISGDRQPKDGCKTHERHNGYLGRRPWEFGAECVEEILGFELSKELPTSDWKAKKLTDAQIEYAGLDGITCIRLYEVLMDTLDRKSVEIGQDIPAAWYMFNNKFKFGEPTRTKLGWDESEVTWRTSD